MINSQVIFVENETAWPLRFHSVQPTYFYMQTLQKYCQSRSATLDFSQFS